MCHLKSEREAHQGPGHLLLQLLLLGVHFVQRRQALVTVLFLRILVLEVFDALGGTFKRCGKHNLSSLEAENGGKQDSFLLR